MLIIQAVVEIRRMRMNPHETSFTPSRKRGHHSHIISAALGIDNWQREQKNVGWRKVWTKYFEFQIVLRCWCATNAPWDQQTTTLSVKHKIIPYNSNTQELSSRRWKSYSFSPEILKHRLRRKLILFSLFTEMKDLLAVGGKHGRIVVKASQTRV